MGIVAMCYSKLKKKSETLLIQKTENEIIPKEHINQGTQGKSP